MMIRELLATVTCALLWILSGCSPPPPDGAESVIVVHGLGRTSASMTILVSRLENAGFRVVSFGYPSTSEPMETLVDRLKAEVEIVQEVYDACERDSQESAGVRHRIEQEKLFNCVN